MYWRYIYHTIAITFIWLTQASFISAMPEPFNHLNLSLVALLILLLFDDLNLLFFWTMLLSFLMSLNSTIPLTLLLISWWLVILIAYLILYQFLTNRSLYSLVILVIGSTVLLEFFILIGAYFSKIFTGLILYEPINSIFFANLFFSITLNALAMLALFSFMGAINTKLKPFLLLKRKR